MQLLLMLQLTLIIATLEVGLARRVRNRCRMNLRLFYDRITRFHTLKDAEYNIADGQMVFSVRQFSYTLLSIE